MLPIIIDSWETIPKLMINVLRRFNIKNHKIFLIMSLNLDRNILGCPISLFLFFDTKWTHDICYLRLIITLRFITLYINRSALSHFSISLEASLFPFSKIVGVYLQNIPWGAFFFRLPIEAINHEKNFLITGTNNNRIKQDLGSIELAIECPNQTVTAFFTGNGICGFALSPWPRRFANSGHFSTMTISNLSNWLQYILKLMILSWRRSS